MGQETEYVGLLPSSVNVAGIEFIEDPNIGDFVRVPIDFESHTDDISKVVRFLAQLTSKHIEGDIRVNDYSAVDDRGVLSTSYRLEEHEGSRSKVSGQTLYIIYPVTIKRRGKPHTFVSLRNDPGFTKGPEILKAFVEEAKAQLKPI